MLEEIYIYKILWEISELTELLSHDMIIVLHLSQ